MIILKSLAWDNLFSYGQNNLIRFDKDPITQLIGKNGHGKSSIALILEETLFNKNSKGIKKADIVNRHIKAKSYSTVIDFDKDEDKYRVTVVRGSTQTVTLTKNSDNISAHTATATFKLIEDILGFDHATFSQLVYQSSASSLAFLTATDTNRKKFLIDLLNLTRYTEAFEIFKKATKEVEQEVNALESKLNTTQAWLEKHLKEKLEVLELKGYPVYEDDPAVETNLLKTQLGSIDALNRKIARNELAKKQQLEINILDLTKPLPEFEDITTITKEKGGHEKTLKDATTLVSKISKLDGVCPTCLQPVNKSLLEGLILEQVVIKAQAEEALEKLNRVIEKHSILVKEANRLTKVKTDWENLHQQIDPSLDSAPLNPDELNTKLKILEDKIKLRSVELEEIQKYNQKASANNARVQLITSQMDEMKSSIGVYSLELSKLQERLSILQILQKTFSTSGLIAYKIECMIKDLEDLVNEYLTEISSGRFQLTFKVSGSDKLNVIITDNGRDIDILALSGGERARVNTATLLAIRKLMQSLSNARINLLILDETIDQLDMDGKDKLVEVLLKEEHLNTFLVSHGYTHPLLEKITVIKENNISRLE